MNQPHIKNYDVGTKLHVGIHEVLIVKYLTSGGFAQIYEVQVSPPSPITGMNVACLKRVIVPNKAGLNALRAEVEAMQLLKGKPHVVSYYDSNAARSITNDGTYEVLMLMELCPGGGLIDFMNTRLQNRLQEFEVLNIMNQVCQGIAAMHSLHPPMIHRDIKIENVLISSNGEYKVCDFGSVSGVIRPPKNTEEFNFVQHDIMKNTTAQYRCPEMLDLYRGQPIDEKSDIWALGVFLYKVCYYTTPFENEGERAILHARFQYPQFPQYSSRLKNLIRMMLMEKPTQRPNICEVLEEVSNMQGIKCPLPNFYLTRAVSYPNVTNSMFPQPSTLPTTNFVNGNMNQIPVANTTNLLNNNNNNFLNNTTNQMPLLNSNIPDNNVPSMTNNFIASNAMNNNNIFQQSKSENTTGGNDPFARLKDNAFANTSVANTNNILSSFNNNNSNTLQPLNRQKGGRGNINQMISNNPVAVTSGPGLRRSNSSLSLTTKSKLTSSSSNNTFSAQTFNSNSNTGDRSTSNNINGMISFNTSPLLSSNEFPSITSFSNNPLLKEDENSKASIKRRVQDLLHDSETPKENVISSSTRNNFTSTMSYQSSSTSTATMTIDLTQHPNAPIETSFNTSSSTINTASKKKGPKPVPPPKPDRLRPKRPPKPAALKGRSLSKTPSIRIEIANRKEESKQRLMDLEDDFANRFPSM